MWNKHPFRELAPPWEVLDPSLYHTHNIDHEKMKKMDREGWTGVTRPLLDPPLETSEKRLYDLTGNSWKSQGKHIDL